jgi:hypothetical protein
VTYRDVLRQWLKPASRGGLRTLAGYFKKNLMHLMESDFSEARDEAWLDRLTPIERFIEPLAVEQAVGAHPEFASFCHELHDVEGFERESKALGITHDGDFTIELAILELPRLTGVRCLYHAINCWFLLGGAGSRHASQATSRKDPDEAVRSSHGVLLEACVLSAMTRSLLEIGCPKPAAGFVENYLNLTEQDFADRSALSEAIRRSPTALLWRNKSWGRWHWPSAGFHIAAVGRPCGYWKRGSVYRRRCMTTSHV